MTWGQRLIILLFLCRNQADGPNDFCVLAITSRGWLHGPMTSAGSHPEDVSHATIGEQYLSPQSVSLAEDLFRLIIFKKPRLGKFFLFPPR